MIINTNKKNNGFIKMIILIIILVATLGYFGISVPAVIESRPVQAVWSFTKTVWKKIVSPTLTYVWDNVLHDFLYKNVVDFFNNAETQVGNIDINSMATTTPTN